MMHILFTRNSSFLSRLIRYLTKEEVSHCVIEQGGVVFHSNLLGGVHLETGTHFHRKNETVYSLEAGAGVGKIEAALERYELSGYDFGGLFYLGLRCVLPFLPKANLWQSSGMMLCTEWVQEALGQKPDPSLTPYKLYLLLSQLPAFKET